MKIIATAKMAHGTFQAKFIPLSKIEEVEKIFVLRKSIGPEIDKVEYVLLPTLTNFSFFNLIITPILLAYYTNKYKADLILSYHVIPHAFFAFFASILTKKPFIIGQTGTLIQRISEKKLIGKGILFVIKKAVYLNVPGNLSKEFWIKMGVSKEKINILHSTIDTNYFKPEDHQKKYDFIYLGRIAPEKGVDLIVRAFKELLNKHPNSKLLIVGDGNELPIIRKMILEFGIQSNVTLTGFQDNVKKWLNLSSIFVMSSNSEGLPTSLMQAMACELICISSNVGNISDLINNNKNGFIFNEINEIELYKLMLNAFGNFNSFSEMRIDARKSIIEKHSYSNAIELWGNLFQSLNLI